MNHRNVLSILGLVLKAEGILLVIPLIISLVLKENSTIPFIITITITLLLGTIFSFKRNKAENLTAKDGFIICGVSWLLLSMFGALPFFLSGHIPSYIDALFEVVSGFTTTGASILTDVETLPRSLLFWRSFTHWIGGMGVLVFILAILPLSSSRTMHLMKAEVPGPKVGKLVSKARFTAQILYAIYVVMTLVQIVLLLFGGMPLFDAVVNSFATAGTGGFAIKNSSIAAYDSAYIETVITVFMIIFGVNLNLYFFMLLGDIKSIVKNRELQVFLSIIAVSIAIISIDTHQIYGSVSESIRYASFQVASVVSTTGFATADFNQWSTLSKTILVILMFSGSCAGSTAGGIKISRIIILLKGAAKELKKMIMPRAVVSVKIEGKTVDNETITGSYAYLVLYFIIFVFSLLAVSLFDSFDMTTNFTAISACFNNIGPGLGEVGPAGNFSGFSNASKIILIFDMLAGRLEIFPVLILFYPSAWKK